MIFDPILTSGTVASKNGLCLCVNLLGILCNRSRGVWILLSVFLCVFLWQRIPGKRTFAISLTAAAAIAGAILVAIPPVRAAILENTVYASTFIGRLLYAVDALPVILRHPLGLGYHGYFFTQGQFQTGVYTVEHVHNELLQLALDVGWLPVASAVIALAGFLRSRRPVQHKMCILFLLLHSLFDFDLQFLGIGFVIALFANGSGRKNYRLSGLARGVVLAVGVLCIGLASAIGTADCLFRGGAYGKSLLCYPFGTRTEIMAMLQEDDMVTVSYLCQTKP